MLTKVSSNLSEHIREKCQRGHCQFSSFPNSLFKKFCLKTIVFPPILLLYICFHTVLQRQLHAFIFRNQFSCGLLSQSLESLLNIALQTMYIKRGKYSKKIIQKQNCCVQIHLKTVQKQVKPNNLNASGDGIWLASIFSHWLVDWQTSWRNDVFGQKLWLYMQNIY